MKSTIFVLSPSKPETFFSRPSICFLGRIKNLIDRLIDNPAFSISANNRRYLHLAIHEFYTYSKARRCPIELISLCVSLMDFIDQKWQRIANCH